MTEMNEQTVRAEARTWPVGHFLPRRQRRVRGLRDVAEEMWKYEGPIEHRRPSRRIAHRYQLV